MEMHQVRYFLAVARVLNFTRAAEECHVAQPSLTRAIKQLEAELGGDLFRRERNLTHLTDLGQRMLPMLQQCFDSAMTAKSLAQSMKAGAVAPLAIGLSLAVDITLIISFVTELVRSLPGLELRFMRGTGPEIAELLKMGEIEVALAGSLGQTWDRLESWALFTEPYKFVVGSEHPLATRLAVSAGGSGQGAPGRALTLRASRRDHGIRHPTWGCSLTPIGLAPSPMSRRCSSPTSASASCRKARPAGSESSSSTSKASTSTARFAFTP